MTLWERYKWPMIIIQWVALIGMAVFLFRTCEANRVAQGNLAAAHDSIKYVKNRNGTLTAMVGMYEVNSQRQAAQVFAKDQQMQEAIKRFSRVTSASKITAVAQIDCTRSDFGRPIIPDSLRRRFNIPPIDIPGSIGKDWFSTQYRIDDNGLQLDSITANIRIKTVTGFKRKWFLGRQYAATEVTPESKNVTITQVVATTVKTPPNWVERALYFMAGAATGTAITK